MEPTVFTEADGEIYDAGALRLRLLAQAPDQPIAVTDNALPPAFPGPVRHRHATMTEMFYVLEGELAFDLAGEQRVLGPGSFVLVPPGVVHTFANPGSAPVRFLEILQPAGNESFLGGLPSPISESSPHVSRGGHHVRRPRILGITSALAD